LAPQETLRHFQLDAGLKIELAAAEPQVIDPVSVRFDERGRMWVVQMRDYPHGPAEGQAPQSRISVLEDRDGDGYYETATIFADQLLFATGVQPWRGGAIVTLAGRVAYMKDTNGDGRADTDETWFTGFVQENSQLRANHPTLALDNHVYVANGLRGGSVLDVRPRRTSGNDPAPGPLPEGEGKKAVNINQMDFRFDPRGTSHESVSGVGQFGLAWDDFGNRFVVSNRNPLKHVVLEDRYIKRNAFLAVPAVFHDVAAAGEKSRVFPLTRAWTTSTLHAGQFTAACGVHLYRGDALPAAYRGNSFTCEPTGNLVHREVLKPQGATFQSRPAQEDREFLASPDEWFRPVNVKEGPDGALYVVDMYRAVIEHPQFVPDELKNRPDLRHGDDRGRIYRIVAADAPRTPHPAKLADLPANELVKLLAHPNAWQRETAQRLLIEREDRSVQPALESLVRSSRQPQAKVHALWTLQGLGLLKAEILMAALEDKQPRVQEHAVLLSERWLGESSVLRERLKQIAAGEDLDGRLRYQLALSIGYFPADEAIGPLERLAVSGAADEWTRRAVASSVADQPGALLSTILGLPLGSAREPTAGQQVLVQELAALVGARRDAREIATVLADLMRLSGGPASQRTQRGVLLGIAQALGRRGSSLAQQLDKLPAEQAGVKQDVERLFARAADLAADKDAEAAARAQSIDLLAYASFALAGPVLAQLVETEPQQELRLKAIDALAAHRDPSIAALLLKDFGSQTPAVRRVVLDAVIGPRDRAAALLDEIAAKRIAASELDRVRADRLAKHSDAKIRERAKAILADALPADRQKVLADYQGVLSLAADPQRGREVFQKNCSTCHRIAGIGTDVAPDIADSRVKKPEQLLTDILQPNRAIDANFINYVVVTADGRTLTGIVAADTSSSITLKQPENKVVTLLRQDIDELRSTGVSLMPEGLEKNIDKQQMADLIAFIKNWRYLDGRTPLGK
jgi:putative membrane-bound dehydrogenase-like protein